MRSPFDTSSSWVAAAALLAHLFLATSLIAGEISPEDREFFETRIRPVLAERCYQCHGADPSKIRGGLVLVDAEGLRAGGDSGAVLVPGAPRGSLLIEALHYKGLTQMPPDGKLPADVIADFELWIERGAPDPRTGTGPAVRATRSSSDSYDYTAGREHWSYRKIAAPKPPEVQNEGWVRTPLDRFVLAALETRGLEPVAPADKETLLRRVTFDLIGLPPTEAEIADFLNDGSPEAFARVVDRLLASPHYGERWGRHWLDVARYADSNGLDENRAHPNAFRYRDYVIESFNKDKPFDRFVHEQIAGDLLPSKTEEQRFEQITGTGFLMMGPKVLAEQDVDKMLIDIVDEQVHTIGRAFLAEPIGCARCHDHKFDPVPTSDYYAMAGILRSTRTMANAAGMRWVERPVTAQDEISKFEEAKARVEKAQGKLQEIVDAQNALVRAPRRQLIPSYMLAAEAVYEESLDYLRRAADSGEEAQEPTPQAILDLANERGLEAAIIERWARVFQREREGKPTPGDAPKPHLAFRIWNAFAASDPADYPEVNERLRAEIASEKLLVPPLARSLLRGRPPESLEEVADRYDALFGMIEIAWDQHRQRLGLKDEDELSAGDFRLPPEQEELRWIVYGDSLGFYFCVLCQSPEDEEGLYSQDARERLKEIRAEIEQLEGLVPPEPPFVMAVEEGEVADLPIHIRGSHLNLADKAVPRGALGVTDHLVPPPAIRTDASGRLELAQWITHPEHPLTARVLVNRVWHWLFGRGLVSTPSNFGTTGGEPTNPELLDWLARRFVSNGWSIKKLQREILLSSTYQLSSDYNAANAAMDELNLYHWRMNRKRLEAEPIRDALLMLSGQLDRTMGGRVEEFSMRGYVFNEGSSFGKTDFYRAPRRTVYLPVVRNAIYKVIAGFDFGDASDSVGRRPSTVVPPQALLMMNSEFVEEQAKGFAELILKSEENPQDRIRAAFRRAYGRLPSEEEVTDSMEFLAATAERANGASDEERELDSWMRLCQVLLAASEMIYVG